MLTLILTVAAAAVAIAAFVSLRRGLQDKDRTDPPKSTTQTTMAVVESVSAAVQTSEVVIEVATPKEAKSVRANSRARNKGQFKADNPATPENEAYKTGTKPRVRVKK